MYDLHIGPIKSYYSKINITYIGLRSVGGGGGGSVDIDNLKVSIGLYLGVTYFWEK